MTVDGLLDDTRSPVIFRGPRKTNLVQRFLKDVLWSKLDFLIFGSFSLPNNGYIVILLSE